VSCVRPGFRLQRAACGGRPVGGWGGLGRVGGQEGGRSSIELSIAAAVAQPWIIRGESARTSRQSACSALHSTRCGTAESSLGSRVWRLFSLTGSGAVSQAAPRRKRRLGSIVWPTLLSSS